MRWQNLSETERWKLQEAIRSGDDIGPQLLPAAIDHLEEQRRAAKIFTIFGAVITVLVALGVGGWTWLVDNNPTGAITVVVLTMVALSTVLVGTGLYRMAQLDRQLRALGTGADDAGESEPKAWTWRTGRALLSVFLAVTTLWFVNLLVLTPLARALGVGALPGPAATVASVVVLFALAIGYYRMLAHRDYL